MNRRELFKGLGAALIAASIPIQISAVEALPTNEIIIYLNRVRLDLLNKIVSPPCIMHADGRIEKMSTQVWEDALHHVNNALKELNA